MIFVKIYRISSNKLPISLFHFKASRCDAYLRVTLNPFQDGGQKAPPTSFPPVTSTNAEIS